MEALAKAIGGLGNGDALMVCKLDRLARSTRDLLNTLAAIADAGATFKSLGDAWADTTTPHGRPMLTVAWRPCGVRASYIEARLTEMKWARPGLAPCGLALTITGQMGPGPALAALRALGRFAEFALRSCTWPNDHHLRPTSLTFIPDSEMDDDEIHPRLSNGGQSHYDMDEAFCARMRKAIEAGLERAPIGVVTTPGTKNPKYVPTEPGPLVSSQRDVEHA